MPVFFGRAVPWASAWWNSTYASADAFQRQITTILLRRYPLVGILVLLGVLWLAWAWANDYVRPTTPGERADLLGKLAQIVGGIVLAYGAYWAARNVLVNREGQITERITRAIDQLGATDDQGNPRPDIRLGAIYALERIARDSPTDHATIIEVLSAYVRRTAPCPRERQDQWLELLGKSWPNPPENPRAGWRAPEDIQAAVSVLCRRDVSSGRGEPILLDLSNTDLRHVSFAGGRLRGTSFNGCDLESAMLYNADLVGALLMGANLRRSVLNGSDLTDGALHDSIFVGAFFTETILRGCNTYGAHFDRAHFRETHLEGVSFSRCWLDGAHFDRARLERTHYYEASLDDASFTESHFNRTDLRGVDLSRVRDLTWQQLAGAAINDQTRLPPQLEPTRSAMMDGVFIRSDVKGDV